MLFDIQAKKNWDTTHIYLDKDSFDIKAVWR